MNLKPGTPIWAVHAGGAAIALALCAAGVFLGVQPAFSRAAEVRALISSNNARSQQARDTETAIISTKKLSDDLATELDKAVQLLPPTKINERLSELTARADSRGVTVEQITPGAPNPAAKYTAVPIKLSGACTYTTLTRLLRELRADFRDMAVTSLQVTGQPAKAGAASGTASDKASYTVEFVWYAAPAVYAGALTQP